MLNTGFDAGKNMTSMMFCGSVNRSKAHPDSFFGFQFKQRTLTLEKMALTLFQLGPTNMKIKRERTETSSLCRIAYTCQTEKLLTSFYK